MMACNCHGKRGEAERRVAPEDQCTMCAYKHVRNARHAWGEFTYELDNRSYVAGQLRLAIEHLKFDHTPTALKCRDLAAVIDEAMDADIRDVAVRLSAIEKDVRTLFYTDHPEAQERILLLKKLYNASNPK